MAAANQPRLITGRQLAREIPPRLRDSCMYTVMGLLCFSVLTLWVPNRWAVNLFHAGIFALTALIVIRHLISPFRLQWSKLLLPLGGAVCIGAVQIAGRQTVYAWATWNSSLAWAAELALVFVATQLFHDERTRRRLLRFLFYFGFAVSVSATAQVMTASGKVFWLFSTGYADYVMGPFVSRNLYSAFVELLLPIALFYTLSQPRHGYIHAAMCSLMFVSVIAGASRAGLLLLSAETVAILWLGAMRGIISTRKLGIALATFAVFAATFIGFAGGAVSHRLRESDPFAGRREMLHSSWDMVRDRPWLGFGLGTWSTVYPQFAYYDDGTLANHAHNDWAEWSCDGGVPMLALILSVAVFSARPAARSLWGLGVIAVELHCLVDSPLQDPVLAAWFFLLLGVLAACPERANDRSS